jgi:hypothetical protein
VWSARKIESESVCACVLEIKYQTQVMVVVVVVIAQHLVEKLQALYLQMLVLVAIEEIEKVDFEKDCTLEYPEKKD